LQKRKRKETVIEYSTVPLRQQLMIIGIMAELLHAGIDPLNAIKSGIEILEEKQRHKYLDLMSGKKIVNQDHLSCSINLILNSSISGSKISETLRLNLETFHRSHRNEVLKAIKKSEVWLLGPLGLCFLPTFMLIAVVPLIGSLITGFIS
jgi:hypothetical protein